ncbi:MAG TPA: hypothetical protein VLV55_11070 [Rhizomicrobium sp.]|nr:hypothetical protein [Rhizomicrobium sp.]
MIRLFPRLLLASLLLFPAMAVARTKHSHAAAAPARAAPSDGGPSVLGVFKDWGAYTRGLGDNKVCYALSEPKSKDPASVKRDPVYFLVNDWPGHKAKGEPEVVPGYQYKDGSPVTVQVGADRFTFFTKNQDNAGGAWALNAADEAKLLAEMRSGGVALVTGTSKRGTVTKDSYSLAGVGDAIDRAHQACGM